jgi:hypothetical protein
MPSVRDAVTRFLERDGHKVDAAPVDPETGTSELLFKTRGQVFSVIANEHEETTLSLSTAYEIPEWARERTQNADVLERVQHDHPDVVFTLAHDGSLFVATLDRKGDSLQALLNSFWNAVGRLRDAGSDAIEDMVDRTESKAAAEKFINSFMMGER